MGKEQEYTLIKVFAGLPRTVRGRPVALSGNGEKLLYCNGNSIYIRNVSDPSDCDIYTQHAKDTTSAAFSPSGYYICSGDIQGKIRIWDTVNKEHILKYEYHLLGGSIKDIAWSEDSKRIAVCGEGREKFASVINWDTGTSCGKLDDPSKPCNNIVIKQSRPYRLAVVGEDYASYFYEGPPFKFKTQHRDHTNFVNCVRYSPDGSKFVTGGADGRCFVYDGKTGELIGEMCESAKRIHNGGIYGLAWSPCGKMLMSCSADKTVKVWNMDAEYFVSNKEICVFEMGKTLEDQQLGCAWLGEHLISVSLNGQLNYWDRENPTVPKKVVQGHNKAVVASCLSDDSAFLFTASYDGRICYWDLSTGVAKVVAGESHTNKVLSMKCCGGTVVTCGMDDTVRFIDVTEKKFKETVVKLDSQPRDCDIGKLGLVVVACVDTVVVLQDGKISNRYKCLGLDPTSIAVSSDLGKVAVGMAPSSVVMYNIQGDKLQEAGSFPSNDKVTSMKFSPDGKYIALCTGKKQVKIVLISDFKTEHANWSSHAGTVNSIDWTPDSKHLASSGIDGHVFTWDVENAKVGPAIRGAHSQSVDVTGVNWLNDDTLLTCGRNDCSIKMWKIHY